MLRRIQQAPVFDPASAQDCRSIHVEAVKVPVPVPVQGELIILDGVAYKVGQSGVAERVPVRQ